MTEKATVERFLDYIKGSKSKNTFKGYKEGIEKFVEYYGKSGDDILEERRQDIMSGDFVQVMRFSRELEKFHRSLIEKGFTINSARNYCLGIRQLFRFYGFPLTNLSSEISQTVQTTKDFVPSIQQYRDMFNCGDIKAKVIISMGLDLAWRIGDYVAIKKGMVPDLEQKAPIPFDLITEKEKVVAKSFLGVESIELLKTYLPTLPKDNLYLFPANHNKHLDDESINYTLRELAKKAKVKVPEGKRLRFHCFRKRFLTTCADLKIDVNTAKILCGKDVESSMLAYLSEVDHAKAFMEVDNQLTLSNGAIKESMASKDAEIARLQKEIQDVKLIMKGMAEIFGEETLQKAIKKLGISATTIEGARPLDILELFKELGKAKEQKDKEEYNLMLANDNNNNH